MTVVLVAAGNGTEAYNRTLDVPPQENVELEGFPPWKGNFTAVGRLEDGRKAETELSRRDFCEACSVTLAIMNGDFFWVTSVT